MTETTNWALKKISESKSKTITALRAVEEANPKLNWRESMTIALKSRGVFEFSFEWSSEWRDCGCACGQACYAWGEYPMDTVTYVEPSGFLKVTMTSSWYDR